MGLAAWIAFTVAYAALALAPGPVILLVMSYSLAGGRRTAAAVVAATTLGDATCLLAAGLGLGALLATSSAAFTALKLAGAAYLVFLGWRLWRSPPEAPGEAAPPARPLRRIFVHTWLVAALNPKTVLFFMVFMPQFLDPARALWPQLAAMSGTILLADLVVDGGYSFFAVSVRRFIRGPRVQQAINRLTGGLLMSEGVIAAAGRAVVP